VAKEKIAANGEYNLSGERYREGGPKSTKYWWQQIESLVETIIPPIKIQKTAFGESGRFPIIDQSQEDIAGWTDDESSLIRPIKPLVIFGDHTCVVKLVETPFAQGADGIKILLTIDTLDPRFLYYVLRMRPLESEGYQRHFSKLKEYKIPVPPLEVQKEIVAEIEGYQKVINGARTVLDHYRPHIPIHPDWPKRELGSLSENLDSRRVPITKGDRKEGPFPYYGASGIVDYVADFIFDEDILLISEDGANLIARSTPIAFSVSGKCWVNNHAHVLKFENPATQKFVEVYLNSISIEEFVTGAAQPKLNQQALNSIPIPIPDDVATQQALVAEIEAEQALVAANRELIERFEKKIQATLARVWGEDEPAPAAA
jgi:type I restriction enzyme M protein